MPKQCIYQCYIYCRNAATNLVEQELLFVGTERGKLVAIRNIIQKVGYNMAHKLIEFHFVPFLNSFNKLHYYI